MSAGKRVRDAASHEECMECSVEGIREIAAYEYRLERAKDDLRAYGEQLYNESLVPTQGPPLHQRVRSVKHLQRQLNVLSRELREALRGEDRPYLSSMSASTAILSSRLKPANSRLAM